LGTRIGLRTTRGIENCDNARSDILADSSGHRLVDFPVSVFRPISSTMLFLPSVRIHLLLVVALACAPGFIAAEATPSVARPAVIASVTLKEDPDSFTLANGIVTARISKRNSNLTSLKFHGIENMGGGGYWEKTQQ